MFSLLNKGIVNRRSYGVDVSERPGSVTITFTNMRRLCALFNKFEDYEAFTKELGAGKGVVKLTVDDTKNGIMRYKFKEEILQLNSITGTGMHLASFSIETGAVCFPVLIGCNGTFLNCNRVETTTYVIDSCCIYDFIHF